MLFSLLQLNYEELLWDWFLLYARLAQDDPPRRSTMAPNHQRLLDQANVLALQDQTVPAQSLPALPSEASQ